MGCVFNRNNANEKRILIYTPTYRKSTGLQYRLSMLTKTLRENRFVVQLLIDNDEPLIRRIYYRFGKQLLKHEYTWRITGKHLANKILKYNPETVSYTHLTLPTKA